MSYTITDSRDGHTKTFITGVTFDGDNNSYVHVMHRNGKHKTYTVDVARKIYRAILAANKDAN